LYIDAVLFLSLAAAVSVADVPKNVEALVLTFPEGASLLAALVNLFVVDGDDGIH